jgi:glycosyltransferase involved in cell wall biosynthesis
MLAVVIPAYNEAENLRELLPRVVEHARALDPESLVMVLDDGSTDDTVAAMSELSSSLPGVSCVSSVRNRGKAAALKTGFGAVL